MQGVSEPNRATTLDRRGPSVAPWPTAVGGGPLPARCTSPLSSAPNGPPSVRLNPQREINGRARLRSDASPANVASWRVGPQAPRGDKATRGLACAASLHSDQGASGGASRHGSFALSRSRYRNGTWFSQCGHGCSTAGGPIKSARSSARGIATSCRRCQSRSSRTGTTPCKGYSVPPTIGVRTSPGRRTRMATSCRRPAPPSRRGRQRA
jgi:hypothetical protein